MLAPRRSYSLAEPGAGYVGFGEVLPFSRFAVRLPTRRNCPLMGVGTTRRSDDFCMENLPIHEQLSQLLGTVSIRADQRKLDFQRLSLRERDEIRLQFMARQPRHRGALSTLTLFAPSLASLLAAEPHLASSILPLWCPHQFNNYLVIVSDIVIGVRHRQGHRGVRPIPTPVIACQHPNRAVVRGSI